MGPIIVTNNPTDAFPKTRVMPANLAKICEMRKEYQGSEAVHMVNADACALANSELVLRGGEGQNRLYRVAGAPSSG